MTRLLQLSFCVAAVFLPIGCSEDSGSDNGNRTERAELTKSHPDAIADEYTNSIGMRLKLIPGGTFNMGSGVSAEELSQRFDCRIRFLRDEFPQHKVTLTKPFYIATTEVTQKQWKLVMKSSPWSGSEGAGSGDDYPATHVTFADVEEFCVRLSKLEGRIYRLPTEAEWEFAMRAGTTTVFSFGDEVDLLPEYGWFSGNAKNAQPVGQLKPNQFGLYDMCGNVFEWCADRHSEDYYSKSPDRDPTGPDTGEYRVKRGGSWFNTARFCRSSFRDDTVVEKSASDVGFRVCSDPK